MSAHLCLLGDANSVHLRRWSQEMLSRGYRVSVVTARPQPIDSVEQRVLPPVARSIDWLWRVGETRRHLAELAPDLVHAHYVTSYGTLAARCGHHPLVMTAWGSDILVTPRRSRPMRWLTGWTLRHADLLTGDSQDLLDEMARYRPRGALRQIHWGADMAKFRPGDWADKRGFQIASLRSWEPNYHVDVIVEAVSLLLQRRPAAGVHLHLLGGGEGEGALRAQVRSLGLAEAVTFHGRVGDTEMVNVLHACKVSVSVPQSDATSVSVLESMACGLPVIASDLPANRQWLDDGQDTLVPRGDVPALAAALDALCGDDARAERIGRANHERMRRDGARSAQMDTMAALYEELLERARRSA
ncbi:glycosyltransferase [Piscinibacter sp.]|uniref:glycosyltransferase n=1 Tax=Piscinibacter sp. TaxID=1903157 RepID=UPI002C299C9E|nr:glycosyltransferase [Albitalea sp.]HUG24364.1 glycosyltransferase [Albitalea sp.]